MVSRPAFWIARPSIKCNRNRTHDGREIPWIDENLSPFTGQWQARSMRISKGTFDGRGDHLRILHCGETLDDPGHIGMLRIEEQKRHLFGPDSPFGQGILHRRQQPLETVLGDVQQRITGQ